VGGEGARTAPVCEAEPLGGRLCQTDFLKDLSVEGALLREILARALTGQEVVRPEIALQVSSPLVAFHHLGHGVLPVCKLCRAHVPGAEDVAPRREYGVYTLISQRGTWAMTPFRRCGEVTPIALRRPAESSGG
jgi:hypothetical protein